MSELTAVYPGTFDPITNGHMDIVTRAVRLVDRLVIGVAGNAGKTPMFDLNERLDMVRREIQSLNSNGSPVVEARPFDNLLMQFASAMDARMIVRGLRAVSDFDFEFQMVGMNARLNPDIEIVFLMASERHQFIASRFVKEIALLGGDVSSFVSHNVAWQLEAKVALPNTPRAATERQL